MIYIITACSRPENLETISKTIPLQCNWVVVHDNKVNTPLLNNAMVLECEDTGMVGIKAQNFALDNLPLTDQDFILLHDDDNIIYPTWYSKVSELINYDFSIMTWGQLNKDGSIRLKPQSQPRVGNIDTASFLISWKYNKHIRHKVDVYEHDGIYAEQCSLNGPLLQINDYLCYYNYLR
jgi:hypothetical protein